MAPIAIITVTYSPGEYLTKFLDSIPAAAAQGAHVVMVDNGSTDGAPEAAVADRDGRVSGPGVESKDAAPDAAGKAKELGLELRYSGGNIGYGSAMNLGARNLRDLRDAGEIDDEFLIISNPDVVFTPGSIDAMLECARRHPRAGAIGPLIREADGSAYPSARSVPRLGAGIGHALLGGVWPSNPWTKQYRHDDDLDREREAGWLSGSCLLLRWKAFESVGGFDERYFMYMEDVDLGDRLGRAGWQNIFTPTAEISHAKGHAAGEHPEKMLPAHHESAYRFQADRLPGAKNAPIRLLLKVGLSVRAKVSVWLAERKRKG